MVRKLVSALAEVGRGTLRGEELAGRLDAKAEPWQPTAPPSGLFLEGISYPDEPFVRPLQPIVPVAR